MIGVPPDQVDMHDDCYVEHTRVSMRALDRMSVDDLDDMPMSLERYVSEALAEGAGCPEYRAWLEKQATKRGLG